MNKHLRSKFIHDLKQDKPATSFITDYLVWMSSEGEEGPAAAAGLESDLAEVFSSVEGLRVLKLLEKSVLNYPMQNGSSDSALREFNAVRNFVLEIRRFASNGRT